MLHIITHSTTFYVIAVNCNDGAWSFRFSHASLRTILASDQFSHRPPGAQLGKRPSQACVRVVVAMYQCNGQSMQNNIAAI